MILADSLYVSGASFFPVLKEMCKLENMCNLSIVGPRTIAPKIVVRKMVDKEEGFREIVKEEFALTTTCQSSGNPVAEKEKSQGSVIARGKVE